MKHFTEYISEFLVSGHTNGVEEDYVDLDLPSGTLWATCNLGASNPAEYGDYYMFGCVKHVTGSVSRTKDSPFSGGQPFLDKDTIKKVMPKYVDEKQMLLQESDPATVKLGADWKTPTFKQLRELRENTTEEQIEYNDVKCINLHSKKDPSKYITIPCAGYVGPIGKKEVGESFYIASNQMYGKSGQLIYILTNIGNKLVESTEFITEALSIRPVRA